MLVASCVVPPRSLGHFRHHIGDDPSLLWCPASTYIMMRKDVSDDEVTLALSAMDRVSLRI